MGVYYVLIGFLIIAGLIQYLCFKDNKWVKAGYLILVGAAMVYLVGSRYGRGFDYYVYIDLQKSLPMMSWQEVLAYPMEPGFMIYAKLISMVSSNPHMLYYVTGFVVVGIALYLYYRYSAIPFVSILFFMALNFYYNTMNSIRYALALAIVMLTYQFLLKTKWTYTKENMNWAVLKKDLLQNFLPYLLIVLLAATFHKSALIMIPLYFVVKIPLNWKTCVFYAVGTIIFCFIAQPITRFFSDLFFHGNYSEVNVYTTPGGSVHAMAPLVICVAIAMTVPRILKKNANALALVNLAIFSLILFAISAFSVFIYTRIAYYTYEFVTFLVPMAVAVFRVTDEEKAKVKALTEKIDAEKVSDDDDDEDEDGSSGRAYREDYKKRKTLIDTMKENREFYWFGLAFSVVMGLFFQYTSYTNGAHDIYPYMSMSNQVNMFSNFVDENDRTARAQYVKEQLNIGRMLKAAQDPNYVIIIAGQGDLFTPDARYPEYVPQYKYSYLEPLEYFGLDTRLAEQYGQSYVAIGEAGKAYHNELSTERIETTYEIDGHTVEVTSSNSSKGEYSSIKIDGEEYCNEWNGLNIVLFDKVTGEVVDSVTCNLANQTLKETVSVSQDTRGSLLWRSPQYAYGVGYDAESVDKKLYGSTN